MTLVARKLDKLEAARSLLLETMQGLESSSVQVEVADVTSYEEISQAIQRAKDKAGEVDVLVCNAGCSRPGYFHEMDLAVFEEQMRLNYMGSVNTAKAAYGGMVARNKGHICFVSSSMALMGFVGYTAYCPSKYAVRGLAECLRNEVQGTGVRISIAFPPDMKTPGFEVENRSKVRPLILSLSISS